MSTQKKIPEVDVLLPANNDEAQEGGNNKNGSPSRRRTSPPKKKVSGDIPISTEHAHTRDKSKHSSPLRTRSNSSEPTASTAPTNDERMASLSPEPKAKRKRGSKRHQPAAIDDPPQVVADSQPPRLGRKHKSTYSLGIDHGLYESSPALAEPSYSPPEASFLSHPHHRQRKGSSSAPNVASSPLSMDPSSPVSSPRSAASDGNYLDSSQLKRRTSGKSSTMPERSGTIESPNSIGKLIQFFGENNVAIDANRIGWAPQPAHVNALKLRKRFGECVPLDALPAYDTSDAQVQSKLGASGHHGSRSSSSAGADEFLEDEEDSDDEARKKNAKQQKSALKIGRFFGDRTASSGSSQKISRKSKSRFLANSGSKERLTKPENDDSAKPSAGPSAQPPNVDPLKLNRFFGERVDIVKSSELTARGPRTARSASVVSPATVVRSPASLEDEDDLALSQSKSPHNKELAGGASIEGSSAVTVCALTALNELQLAAHISPYDGDSSSDLASAEDEEEVKPKPAKTKKASGRRLGHSGTHSAGTPLQTPSSTMFTASGSSTVTATLATTTFSTPDLPHPNAWSTAEISPPPYAVGQGRSSKRSASSNDLMLSGVSRSFMSAPTSPAAHQQQHHYAHDGDQSERPALSPPHASRLEHRLDASLLSPGRPAIRSSRSARSVLQTRNSPVAFIDLSNVQRISSISSPNSAHTPGSMPSSAGSPRTAPLSATRSAIRANVERSRSANLTNPISPHSSQLSVNGPSVSRKSSGNSLHLIVARIEDMDPLNEAQEQGEEVLAGVSAEGSPSSAGALAISPIDAGLSPRGINIVRQPSREMRHAVSGSCLPSMDASSNIAPERHSPPRRRRNTQVSPEERPPIHTPPSFRKNQQAAAPASPSVSTASSALVPDLDPGVESGPGTTDAEIWTEQVRESQRNRKLRKMFGENVSQTDLAMAPQSDNVNWKKLNKKLGLDTGAPGPSGGD